MATSDREVKTKVVLFLGSGFSAALDLPTTDQLTGKLLESCADASSIKIIEEFISLRISEFWKAVFGWNPGLRPPTLEDHFTQIDMAANSGHHLGAAYGPRELRAIRRMSIHRIFTLLKSPGVQVTRVIEFLKRANEAFEITFVTTNWDTVVEWYLEDLLGIPISYGDEVTPTETRAPAYRLLFLKLHGCTNRGYCDCCRNPVRLEGLEDAVVRLDLLLREEDFRLFNGGEQAAENSRRKRSENQMYAAARQCSDCGAQISLRIGTFSYRKDLNPHAFYTIWDKARTSLQFAEKWLFVGYSLPEADIEIRHLLKSAQLARRNPSGVAIDIVLKEDCEAGERYRRFFGVRDEQVFQAGLEEWITNRLEHYCC